MSQLRGLREKFKKAIVLGVIQAPTMPLQWMCQCLTGLELSCFNLSPGPVVGPASTSQLRLP